MSGTKEDFWPADIAQTTLVTPVFIMREQATLLGEKTKQLISAAVVGIPSASNSLFIWSFQLSSAALGTYKYEVFRVVHPLTLYPVTFNWEYSPVANPVKPAQN